MSKEIREVMVKAKGIIQIKGLKEDTGKRKATKAADSRKIKKLTDPNM